MSNPGHDLPTGRPVAVTGGGRASRGAESDSLTALLAGVADGEVNAFAALYDRTCARLYGVALQVLQDPTSAQEVTERVYLQIWANARFDPRREGSPQAWLTTLTHRAAVQRARAEPGCTARTSLRSNGNRVGGCHCVIDAVGHHPAGGDALNDSQRETITLAYYGALTYQQVAELLEVPQSTIRSRIRAALTRLGESVGTL